MNEEHVIGERVYQECITNFVVETQGWSFELVQRVAKRLNEQRANFEALEPVVIWIPQVTAFIVPGRYAYISRELLQRALYEDAVALVLAHEFAHHDLGHVKLFTSTLSVLKYLPAGSYIASTMRAMERLFFSTEQELEADRYGLELCLSAGYDGHRCLQLFELLEAHLLDWGDLNGVFGSQEQEATDNILPGHLGQWFGQVGAWTAQRMSGYPALRTRKQTLLTRLSNQL